MFTSNPELLSNDFGANPEAPHYLTPVFFKKEVMQKYYRSPSEYEVCDSSLSRRGGWNLRFDNNLVDCVSVFLGDLGRGLPENEQKYWATFNIIPDGRQISETNIQRNLMGNFFVPESPEHKFKNEFRKLQNQWLKRYGWSLFLPLCEKDAHYFLSLRSMITNEQAEFDEQILALTKITIDSVNVVELRELLKINNKEAKSIFLIEKLLEVKNVTNVEHHIKLLKTIQGLRSTGVAHRKGNNYDNVLIKSSINQKNYQAEFDQFLHNLVNLFEEILLLCTPN
jgi:hypothetical protein